MKERSINKRFLNTLRERFKKRSFSTHEAEALYLSDHARPRTAWYVKEGDPAPVLDHSGDCQWPCMSARNTLCAAVQHRMLRRVTRGVYRF